MTTSPRSLPPSDDPLPFTSFRRLMKRLKGLAALCRSAEFSAALELTSEGYLTVARFPEEPNPWDRSISQRRWEEILQCYRRSLRLLVIFTHWYMLTKLLHL